MKKTLVFAIVASVMWISSPDVGAVDYYVDATAGNDDYNGLYSTPQGGDDGPWKTIVRVNEEISELQDNTTIRFKRGEIWTGDATLGFRNGHSVGWPYVNGITFEDYGSGQKPKFDGNSQQPIHINSENRLSNLTIRNINCDGTWHTDVSGSNIYVRKVAGLTIDGLEADGHSGAPNVNAKNGMSITECNGDIVIKNCVLQNWGPIDLPVLSTDYQAISLLTWPDKIQPSSVKIHDNILHHVNADCLQARNIKPTGGEDSFEIYNNIGYYVGENIFDFKSCSYIDLHHNTMYLDSPVSLGGSGGGGGGQSAMVFHTASPEGEWPCEYVKIRENYIYDWPGVGLGLTGTGTRSAHFYVYRNYVKDVRQPVLVATMEDVHIFDNIIESTSNTPVGYDGYDRNGIYLQSNYNDVFIYNNLIYSDAGHDYGIYIRSTDSQPYLSSTIKNNIFYTTSANSNDYPFRWDGLVGTSEAPAVSHNIYYNPNKTNRIKWGRYPGTITSYYDTDQELWRNAGHPGALFADPLFVNQSAGDFALQPTSPAIDSGANLGSPYNLGLNPASTWPNNVSTLDQNNCGTGWEIGAYVSAGDADINNDGKVNIEDFAILSLWWNDEGGCVEPGWCGGADFNMSGTVDMLDFTYFAENWLRQAN